MQQRYQKNVGQSFSKETQAACLDQSIAVIGVGGVGGYLLEHLVRMGAKRVLIFDGDIFESSNLNRQRFCNSETIGQYKSLAAAEALRDINEEVEIVPVTDFFSGQYIDLLLQNRVSMVFHCADYGANVGALNYGLSRCFANRIPVIKTGLHADAVSASLLRPDDLELWLSIKRASEVQVSLNKPLNIAALSHRCSLAASLATEVYLGALTNRFPALTSFSLVYEFDSMQTFLES